MPSNNVTQLVMEIASTIAIAKAKAAAVEGEPLVGAVAERLVNGGIQADLREAAKRAREYCEALRKASGIRDVLPTGDLTDERLAGIILERLRRRREEQSSSPA